MPVSWDSTSGFEQTPVNTTLGNLARATLPRVVTPALEWATLPQSGGLLVLEWATLPRVLPPPRVSWLPCPECSLLLG